MVDEGESSMFGRSALTLLTLEILLAMYDALCECMYVLWFLQCNMIYIVCYFATLRFRTLEVIQTLKVCIVVPWRFVLGKVCFRYSL